jgi:hypothetical protein
MSQSKALVGSKEKVHYYKSNILIKYVRTRGAFRIKVNYES